MRLSEAQHLRAFEHSEESHDIVYYNAWDAYHWRENENRDKDDWRNGHFDAVILHNTFLSCRYSGPEFYNVENCFNWISEMPCVKVALPQDEYDHAEVLDEWLFKWNVKVIFTVCHLGNSPNLYPLSSHSARFYPALTGYLGAEDFEKKYNYLPLEKRPYDLVYRARKLPYWFGSHGQMKHLICEEVKCEAANAGLRVDMSTDPSDAVVGPNWLNFLAQGRCTIGCESGASVIDRRGEMHSRVKLIMNQRPGLSFAELSANMPDGWDAYPIKTISPRHFEAICTRTCQILVEGEYNGILLPDRHYLALKSDFSNLREVLKKSRDSALLQELTDNAFNDIVGSDKYSYESFASEVEAAIREAQTQMEQESNLIANIQGEDHLRVLERQLIGERHRNELLSIQLKEAQFADGMFVILLIRFLLKKPKLLIKIVGSLLFGLLVFAVFIAVLVRCFMLIG